MNYRIKIVLFIKTHVVPKIKIKTPYFLTHSYPLLDFIYSTKNKYVACAISKNGCSSIYSSVLSYDFSQDFDKDKKIWHQYKSWAKHDSKCRLLYNTLPDSKIKEFIGYRKFIVLRDPMDRMISFINNIYKEEEYDYLFNKNVSAEKFIDKVLDWYPIMIDYTRKDFRYDKHAIPQRVYYEKFKAAFGDELEIVMIEDLPSYFEQLTGKPLIKNNVTKPSEKVCTRETLTPKQLQRIENFLAKHEFCKDDEYTRMFRKN